MVALQPTGADAGLHLLFPLMMAMANAVFHVLTRAIAADEEPLAMLFLVAAVAFMITSLALPWTWSWLSLSDWGWLILGGAFGTMAHLLLILAFRLAQTAIVSPMIYAQIASAALLGWLVFGEIPSAATVVGAAIVIVSGVALIRASA